MVLERLAEASRARVAATKMRLTPDAIRKWALPLSSNMGYPFERALAAPGLSYIGEVKKASPFAGVLTHQYDYTRYAREYEQAGAAAVAVVTETEYFMGETDHLCEIAGQLHIPTLRRDFIVDEYQLYETKLLGASAILIVASIIDDRSLRAFIRQAKTLGLSAVVEVHDERQLDAALVAGARIIGVNNRDLHPLKTDMETCERLRPLVPPGVLFIAQSGVAAREDAARMEAIGADAAIVGDALMLAEDKTARFMALRGIMG